jgi:hypothetical protein
MEIFEVHITGNESILNSAKSLGVKTISVDLLHPDGSRLRTEHMTSQIYRFANYQDCKKYVDELVGQLVGVEIHRVKIESPCYEHYMDESLYVESHFPATDWSYPVSRNVRKEDRLATDREYKEGAEPGYYGFRERHAGRDLELCLYDSNPQEDLDWLQLYSAWNSAHT